MPLPGSAALISTRCGRTARVSRQKGGQVGERRAAPTQTPHRARGDVWKDGRRTGGDLAEQGDALVLRELRPSL